MLDGQEIIDVLIPLLIAVVLGGLIGLERELKGRWAGLRTHVMVSFGAAIFILAGLKATEGMPSELSRIIQGIATGIGFIGAGTIIKLTDRVEVQGLTTASSIWLTAAVGTAVGLKMYVLALCSVIVALIVLRGMRTVEGLLLRFTKSSNTPSGREDSASESEERDAVE